MSLYMWPVVIFVTVMCAILGVSLALEKADRKFERLTLLAELDQATANVQLPHAGQLPYLPPEDLPPAVNSRERVDHIERVMLWWEAEDEVRRIWAHLDAHPEEWQR